MYPLVFLFLCTALAYIRIEENGSDDAKRLMNMFVAFLTLPFIQIIKDIKDFFRLR